MAPSKTRLSYLSSRGGASHSRLGRQLYQCHAFLTTTPCEATPFSTMLHNQRSKEKVCSVYNNTRWSTLAYPEAILGLGHKPRPNVGFKLRNNTSCCFHLLFNTKTKIKSLRTEYIIITQYMTNDRYIDRYST